MIPKKPNEIGQRLRQWGSSRFPSQAAFARALGLVPQNLTPYLNGITLPGNTIQAKLREIGCDIEWLMTGKTGYGSKKHSAAAVRERYEDYIPKNLPEKTRKQIKQMCEELSKLDATEIDRAREIIRTIFGTKKGR